MTLEEALAFWYGRINYEVKAAGPGDLKLERMRALLRQLGDPHLHVRSVHITGTKGKGSTAAMLASVLRQAGYRVGLFTSPHLVRVNERIQVNGVPISDAELAARMAEIAAAESHLTDRPSFFEIGTALGFLHFAYRRCEVNVVEVGLGGRFDSTNVIEPVVSVITSVGLDHMAQLGQTLEAIAFQKAGIIKRLVPVVSGVTEPGPVKVIATVAKEESAPLSILNKDFDFTYHPSQTGRPLSTIRVSRNEYVSLPLGLLGRHQAMNAAIVAETVERLREAGLSIPGIAVTAGLTRTVWPARIESISHRPEIIVDTAHNGPSIAALVRTISESVPVSGKKICLFAVSNDKPFAEMLALLAPAFDELFLTKYGNNPRCVPPERLAEALAKIDPTKRVRIFHTASDALSEARGEVKEDDLICITGSFFLAGELRPLLVEGTN
jgi:dihydrofolate synthase/folylpolyglutamate synthase